jgi:hypothetical protein
MIRKRHNNDTKNLMDEIENGMASRNLGVPTVQEFSERTAKQDAEKRYKKTVISIRFDDGDYEQLKRIALEQGTTGAALIRKAVKDIIRVS